MPPALYDAPRVGGDILSYCTRCKMELAHVIMAMVDGRPFRVICKTCKSEHKHKNASVPSRSSRLAALSPKKPTPPKSAVRVVELWERKMSENQAKAVLSYRPQETFKQGDIVQHTQFGMGIVEEVKSNKITILFRDSEKILIHGLK